MVCLCEGTCSDHHYLDELGVCRESVVECSNDDKYDSNHSTSNDDGKCVLCSLTADTESDCAGKKQNAHPVYVREMCTVVLLL